MKRTLFLVFSLALCLSLWAQQAKPIKVACIGNSITYGAGIGNRFQDSYPGILAQWLGGSITEMRGWRDMIKDDLRQRFPQTEFTFIDAGIPSTGTTPHAFRFENDVLAHGTPDLLFVEGAVTRHSLRLRTAKGERTDCIIRNFVVNGN